ncbi:MAG: membrane protein insertion efficiency factor YidD [Bacilli bacterium]|nr:membrane protein insertion efficiency factor YidD [Bacilli bacterium]MDD4608502.1 membrane protein insertion efficiency factor YidD [Bacilli bacterium]
MKYILIKLIKTYQKIPGSFHNQCRHIPTCSNYGIEAIEIHGSFKGSFLTIKRILKCNPLGTSGYDPVPRRREKNEQKN